MIWSKNLLSKDMNLELNNLYHEYIVTVLEKMEAISTSTLKVETLAQAFSTLYTVIHIICIDTQTVSSLLAMHGSGE